MLAATILVLLILVAFIVSGVLVGVLKGVILVVFAAPVLAVGVVALILHAPGRS